MIEEDGSKEKLGLQSAISGVVFLNRMTKRTLMGYDFTNKFVSTIIPNYIALLMDFSFIYRTLRKLFKVDPADYMLSICGNDALRELSSPGKSGSFFYLTNDDRYMIKTMKKSEAKVRSGFLAFIFEPIRGVVVWANLASLCRF